VAHENLIRFWDCVNREEIMTLAGHTDFVQTLSFFANGRVLISSGADNTIKFWDVADNRLIATCASKGKDFVVYTPDGRYYGTGEALDSLHFVSGTRIIELDNMASRYTKNLLPLVLKNYTSQGLVEYAGKIGSTGKEVVINHPDTEKLYNNGDTFFVMVNGEKIILTVKTGMKTITKCKTSTDADAGKLQKGMAVFRDVQ
jgi:hypothetical protein